MKLFKLGVAALAGCVMAAPVLADDAKDDRREAFKKQILEKFDKDGDGKLSDDEKSAARAEFQKRRGEGGGRPAINREEILKKFDKNENGKIDPEEKQAVAEHFKNRFGQGQGRPGAGRHEEILKRFDEDKDGKLSEAERAKAREAFRKQAGDKGARFQEAIKKFDKDGDGKLSDEEKAALRKHFQELREKGGAGNRPARPEGAKGRLSKEEILKKFDKNGDGEIDAEERKAAFEARKAEQDKK